jgi:uncharacterized protein YegP (UPF0339 family)
MAKKIALTFEIQRASNKQFFVRIVMRNGKQTFTSGEQYLRRGAARKAIDSLLIAIDSTDYEIVDLTQ